MIKLQGSPKQVAWAEKLRMECLATLDQAMEAHTRQHMALSTPDQSFMREIYEKEKTYMGELREWLSQQESASWWIDHRDAELGSLAADFAYDMHYDDYADVVWPDWWYLLHE